MKKSVLFSLVLFVGFGISAMEVEEKEVPSKRKLRKEGKDSKRRCDEPFPYDQLPQELQCKIARLVQPDQMPIAPKDAIQDIAEYTNGHYLVDSVAVVSDDSRVVSVGGDNNLKIADANSGEVLEEYAYERWVDCPTAVVSDNSTMVSVGRVVQEWNNQWDNNKVKIVADGKVLAEYAHDSEVNSVAVFSSGDRVVSGGYDNKVKIKSFVPLLLAMYTLEKPNLDRYRLLKLVQESLIKEKKPLIIGKSDRAVLEEMPELKELLKIETNRDTEDKKAELWRLQMKYAKKTEE